MLGVSGLIGNNILKVLSQKASLDVFGTVRSDSSLKHFKSPLVNKILSGIDAEDYSKMVSMFGTIRPDVVINCIGVTKHKEKNMVNVKTKTCDFDGCETIPVYNIKGEKKALFCLKHKGKK